MTQDTPAAKTVIKGSEALHEAVGSHLGYSDWLHIDQDRVNLFAEATGDHQWIHVDPERAAEGPFGSAIAHGYLTLALSNLFLPQIVEVSGFSAGVNYGVDKVRFPSPVRVGANIRGGATLTSVGEVKGGLQTEMALAIEVEHESKPACVLTAISRWLR